MQLKYNAQEDSAEVQCATQSYECEIKGKSPDRYHHRQWSAACKIPRGNVFQLRILSINSEDRIKTVQADKNSELSPIKQLVLGFVHGNLLPQVGTGRHGPLRGPSSSLGTTGAGLEDVRRLSSFYLCPFQPSFHNAAPVNLAQF